MKRWHYVPKLFSAICLNGKRLVVLCIYLNTHSLQSLINFHLNTEYCSPTISPRLAQNTLTEYIPSRSFCFHAKSSVHFSNRSLSILQRQENKLCRLWYNDKKSLDKHFFLHLPELLCPLAFCFYLTFKLSINLF